MSSNIAERESNDCQYGASLLHRTVPYRGVCPTG